MERVALNQGKFQNFGPAAKHWYLLCQGLEDHEQESNDFGPALAIISRSWGGQKELIAGWAPSVGRDSDDP